MAWSDVQRVSTRWFLNGTSPSLAVSSTASGNLLVMAVLTCDLVGSTFGFPSGWATPVHITGSNAQLWISWYINNPGGITSVQITGVTNTTNTDVVFFEKHSDQASYVKDISALAAGTGTALAASATLAHTAELVFGFGALSLANDTGTPTYDSGFTGQVIGHDSNGTSYNEFNDSYSGTSGSVTITPSISIAGQTWVAGIIAFDDTAAPTTLTRSVAAQVAIFETLSRSIQVQVSIKTTLTRSVQAQVSIADAPSRVIAAQVAIFETLSRSVTAKVAIFETLSRDVQAQIQIAGRQRFIAAQVGLFTRHQRAVKAQVAISIPIRHIAAQVAIKKTLTRSVVAQVAIDRNRRYIRAFVALRAGAPYEMPRVDVVPAAQPFPVPEEPPELGPPSKEDVQ